MDLTSINGVVAFRQALTQQQIDIAVMAKSQQVMRDQGEAVLALLESAAQAAADLASASGSGNGLDVVA